MKQERKGFCGTDNNMSDCMNKIASIHIASDCYAWGKIKLRHPAMSLCHASNCNKRTTNLFVNLPSVN